jgi:hypothetical protein
VRKAIAGIMLILGLCLFISALVDYRRDAVEAADRSGAAFDVEIYHQSVANDRLEIENDKLDQEIAIRRHRTNDGSKLAAAKLKLASDEEMYEKATARNSSRRQPDQQSEIFRGAAGFVALVAGSILLGAKQRVSH